MYSVIGDTVLDPFLGVGTTSFASMSCGRNSCGFEIDSNLMPVIKEGVNNVISLSLDRLKNRLRDHELFVDDRLLKGKEFKHYNKYYDFPVMTSQESDLCFISPYDIYEQEDNVFRVVNRRI
jgi:hypothetical protein